MIDLISELKQHIDLTPELEKAIYNLVSERSYRKGDTISAIADMRSNIFFMLSGSARVFYMARGKEHTYSFAFDAEAISMPQALISDQSYVTTIEFLEPSRVVIVPLEKLQTAIRNCEPTVAAIIIDKFINSMHKHVIQLEERILMHQTCSAPEKFQWLLKRYPKILERANLTQIASYLGITKETLYRIRNGKY